MSIKIPTTETSILSSIMKYSKAIPFIFSLITLLLIFYDLGFTKSEGILQTLHISYMLTLIVGVVSLVSKYIIQEPIPKPKAWFFDFVLLAWLSYLIMFLWKILSEDLSGDVYSGQSLRLNSGLILIFIREFSDLQLNFKRKVLQPAQLFIFSFLILIILGALLLMLPRATYTGVSFLDALFTATSAVCVTGLIVVDTGSYFTPFGQMVILGLIQIGGLGIMTFASYFSYFFSGSSSYENHLMLRDMTNSNKISEVFVVLKRIILLTFLIEGIGATLIYFSLPKIAHDSNVSPVFFSLFHSISAFCNAGFSTLTDGLYDTAFKYHYALQLVITGLIIFGGLGFPIIFNFYRYLSHLILNRLLPYSLNKNVKHQAWVINMNTRIVSITTLILIVGGSICFYLMEYNSTLSGHSVSGKWITAFFTSVTTRTAGFNTIDFSEMRLSSLLIVFILMWIGASPGSTGGGIKTSTIAIATINFISVARGKDRMELFNREISENSVRRAFAIIALSFVVIGLSTTALTLSDPDKSILNLAFESVSAYSTVGLSIGITAQLSQTGKFIIILTMFIGRVSMLTILIAFIRKVKYTNYRYPKEEILIN